MAFFVANWKMNQPYQKAISFVKDNQDELEQIAQGYHEIVIAPSFVCLERMHQMLKSSRVQLSAQNCAPFISGAYTGEVDAASLAQVGCSYAIIGHSERRRYFCETNEIIAQKAGLLLRNQITPIICIGESQEDHEKKRATRTLDSQLTSLIPILKNKGSRFYLAYEPEWAIGTGRVPSPDELAETFSWISDYLYAKGCHEFKLLYGGSVDETNVSKFFSIPSIGGLLIGSASCDFQRFKKIVSLAPKD